MGCVSIRGHISPEEEAITLMESQLEYFKNTCIEVDHVIRKYSSSSQTNSYQWEQIVENLELKIENNPVCPLIEDFYNQLKGENSVFDTKVLLIAGILLSNGMSRQKARLLFEVFDLENSDSLSLQDVQELVQLIKYIVVDLLPKLVHNSTNPPSSRNDVLSYVEKINEKFDQANENLIKMIFGDKQSVALKDFIILFDNEKYGRILTPFGFRNYVLGLLSDDDE